MSTFDLSTPISAGRLVSRTGKDTVSSDLRAMVRQAWPDLTPDAKLVIVPHDDFELIVEMTEGRPMMAMRGVVTFSLPAPPTRRERMAETLSDIAFKTGLMLWGWLVIAALLRAVR